MDNRKPLILLNSGFFKYKKSRGVAGPAALRFYVIPSQKPSGGPPQYKYYHYGYDADFAHSRMDHIFTIIHKLT